jgi:IS30 family transposase
LLEKHDLCGKSLDEVNLYLDRNGIRISTGTIVDATIVAPSAKNSKKERDPQMHQIKKGNQYYFGAKVHIGVDSKEGIVHSICTSAASVHDKHMLLDLLHGEGKNWRIQQRSATAIRAVGVSQAIIEQLTPFAHMAHTMTTDNGKEFAQHERIAAELKLSYYFAHPHAAWERGANENLNGLLRQFFPKHRKLEEVSDEEIAQAQHRLNHRPRKCLEYKTPHQVFCEQLHSSQPVALRCCIRPLKIF